jgi:putative Ca2+/H+ antiporter (TMEM165/GDT1 family)
MAHTTRVWRDLWHIVQSGDRVGQCANGMHLIPRWFFMEAFLVSTGVVALAEIGDKTQLLALVLAARFRAPLAITLGILGATLANHALAATLGVWMASWLTPDILARTVAVSFLAMAVWTLFEDSLDDAPKVTGQASAFVATLVAFFIVEIGDKTQIATVALAARFQDMLWVTAGTTLGMMIANTPVVFLGDWVTRKVPLKMIRFIAAGLFLALGIFALLGALSGSF